VIVIEGDTIAEGGLLFVGLVYVLNPAAFNTDSRDNFPFDPNDMLLQLFFIDEEGDPGPDIYSAGGFFTSDADGDGVLDSVDNCPLIVNPGQFDTDGDGVGNVCDDDGPPVDAGPPADPGRPSDPGPPAGTPGVGPPDNPGPPL
jgi:hypothetical protein